MKPSGNHRQIDCSFSPCRSNLHLQPAVANIARREKSNASFSECLDHRCNAPRPVAHVWNVLSHHGRPLHVKHRTGKRRRTLIAYQHPTFNGLLLVLLVLSLLCDIASGFRIEDVLRTSKRRRSVLHTLAGNGESLVDRGEPPTPRMLFAPRDEASIPSFSISAAPKTSEPATTRANTTTITTTRSSLATQSATPTNSPIPQAFDTSLGNNFTASCPGFFNSFLKNSTFQQCVPFSLLLQVR